MQNAGLIRRAHLQTRPTSLIYIFMEHTDRCYLLFLLTLTKYPFLYQITNYIPFSSDKLHQLHHFFLSTWQITSPPRKKEIVDNELAFGCILWDIRKICTRNPMRSNRKTVRSGDPNIRNLISFVSGFSWQITSLTSLLFTLLFTLYLRFFSAIN